MEIFTASLYARPAKMTSGRSQGRPRRTAGDPGGSPQVEERSAEPMQTCSKKIQAVEDAPRRQAPRALWIAPGRR